jgi:hypothetical protein
MKIVTSGTSSRLRKKALQDPSYTLANMLIDGRKYETSSAQAEGIEEQFKSKENINTATTSTTMRKCVIIAVSSIHPKIDRALRSLLFVIAVA